DVNISLVRSDGISADDHTFDNAVWIAFHEASVHVGTGIAFVSVGDDIFWLTMRPADTFPFDGSRKASAASATKARFFDFVDDIFRCHFGKYLGQRLIAVDIEIGLDF